MRFRFGELDLSQWWQLQAHHDGIHLAQIREIKVRDSRRHRRHRRHWALCALLATATVAGADPSGMLAEAADRAGADGMASIIAHELEGRSFKELAAETGVSVNTLLSRKRYAVLHLRERLQRVYDEFTK